MTDFIGPMPINQLGKHKRSCALKKLYPCSVLESFCKPIFFALDEFHGLMDEKVYFRRVFHQMLHPGLGEGINTPRE
jgi:hypothetical protein